ncbi:BrnT family toxin [Bdellovibrio sp. GT3]|uniref:BrnT family toxin n=1 Tax=Bdellovibrio sp. GT3 TaxID=3136282 RepID=UPI00403FF745
MYIHNKGILFQWDPTKSARNILKHGIDFSEAGTVWLDASILIEEDLKHSQNEKRFTALGLSMNGRILSVTFTIRRSADEKKEIQYCRIINARSASKSEKNRYSQRSKG